MDLNFNTITPWSGMRRCVINPDTTIAYYLHPDNSDKKADGSDVDWTEVEALGQNVMVEIPKFWYEKKVEGDDVTFSVSNRETEGMKLHPAFMKYGEHKVDYRYYSAYMGWRDGSGRLRSLPYKTATASQTIGVFRTQAQANGDSWEQVDYYLLYAIQMLYITEYGHPDSQTMIGRGYVDGNASYANTGSTNQYGNSTFGETSGKQQMSYRGIEDFWGNYYYWIDGIVSDSSRRAMVGSVNFNDNGDGYKTIGNNYSSNLAGYIGDIQDHEELGFLIGATGGSASSKFYDYGRLNASRVASFGGSRSDGSAAGAFMLRLSNSASSSSAAVAARLTL